ncbi:MAG: hypothetical protein ACXVBW_04295, partial [Bdellovibrionota bacterium]
MNILGQAAGSLTTQVTGSTAQNNALQAGTQSAALHAAATTAEAAGGTQLSIGALNMAMGAAQLAASRKHKANAGTLSDSVNNNSAGFANPIADAALGQDNSLGRSRKDDGFVTAVGSDGDKAKRAQNAMGMISAKGDAEVGKVRYTEAQVVQAEESAKTEAQRVDAKHMRSERDADLATHKKDRDNKLQNIQSQMQAMGETASGEQMRMAKEAEAGGAMSLIQGVAQAAGGAASLAAGLKLEDAANMAATGPSF